MQNQATLREATTTEMAKILGIHIRTLQKLERDNWISGKIGHDRWDIGRTTRYYLTHIELEAITSRR
ncbi:hypothetical protein [Agrobacterium sp. Azo12]|uniref:hypothetical protein n=1 Tax=Agrobacterium sp. Azo12 TaxID=3031129 RepID=UPI0023D86DB5|nr:hypothetical protein [Agrobacterium sp. Azo12]MDO5896544.1 hypothetical protein [Agrobacterium sp. Azo12]